MKFEVGDTVRLPWRFQGLTCYGKVAAVYDNLPAGPAVKLKWSYGRRWRQEGVATVAELEAEAEAFAEHRRKARLGSKMVAP